MKLPHAAALALVGWYLMLPPKQDIQAPIAKWRIVGNYDSADQCFTDKAWYVGHAELRAIQRRKAGLPP